jgi:4-alpha-glucanotransferase
MNAMLDELAHRYGIALEYDDFAGGRVVASDAAKQLLLAALGAPCADADDMAARLAEAPSAPDVTVRASRGARCFVPEWLDRGRAWGVALQLYQLRTRRSWGIGDFADLAETARAAARAGADFVGVNPLHAPLIADAERSSPFSPSNRRFLNVLYIAPDLLPGLRSEAVDRSESDRLQREELVDYPAVARLKRRVLYRTFSRWRDGSWPSDAPYDERSFRRFRDAGGQALQRHAVFDALSEEMIARGHGAGWSEWPEAYRRPDGEAVNAFAAEQSETVAFYAWLQWIADLQLGFAAAAAREAGMRIGLYLDLAVGEIADGSATWSDRGLYLSDVGVGAPPDYFNEAGQDWGLAPLSPSELRRRDLRPYAELMGAVMRHAGALRIDHAMGIHRLFVIPHGLPARDGVYVHYPLRQILQTLSESSLEARTIVIGEDLGVVPHGFRHAMATSEIHSYRVLYFERTGDELRSPKRYPRKALACVSTHDLPTLEGWWAGDDIALRRGFGFIDEDSARKQSDERSLERHGLLASLLGSGRLRAAAGGSNASDPPALDDALAAALHAHAADSPARLFAVRLEDLAGEHRPVNVPSTTGDQYPNWRRRLSVTLDELVASRRYREITEAVAAVRPQVP